MSEDIQIIITTIMRNDLLENLLRSIPRVFLPQVMIGDQNPRHLAADWKRRYPSVTRIQLPFDCGLSKARNTLVAESQKRYILLLEDDFEWTDQTDISKLLRVMQSDREIGVVGGEVRQADQPIRFEFLPLIVGDTLYHAPDGDQYESISGVKTKRTGCVMNFALMRREALLDSPWDNKLKVREHLDFFVRFYKTNWRIYFTPEVSIKDAKGRPTTEYKALKDRDQYQVKMMRKHGLKKIKYQNGSTRLLVDGKIVKSNEQPIAS